MRSSPPNFPIKLKKRIQELQTSLKLVNNNCYDVDAEDEVDDHLEMTETSEADTINIAFITTPDLLPLSARRDAQVHHCVGERTRALYFVFKIDIFP